MYLNIEYICIWVYIYIYTYTCSPYCSPILWYIFHGVTASPLWWSWFYRRHNAKTLTRLSQQILRKPNLFHFHFNPVYFIFIIFHFWVFTAAESLTLLYKRAPFRMIRHVSGNVLNYGCPWKQQECFFLVPVFFFVIFLYFFY